MQANMNILLSFQFKSGIEIDMQYTPCISKSITFLLHFSCFRKWSRGIIACFFFSLSLANSTEENCSWVACWSISLFFMILSFNLSISLLWFWFSVLWQDSLIQFDLLYFFQFNLILYWSYRMRLVLILVFRSKWKIARLIIKHINILQGRTAWDYRSLPLKDHTDNRG